MTAAVGGIVLLSALAALPSALSADTPLAVKDRFLENAQAALEAERSGHEPALDRFEQALRWAEALQPMSVSRGLVSMADDENRLAYKPSPSERLLLHAFALLARARAGLQEGAGVEGKRLDDWAAVCAGRDDGAIALKLAFPRLLSAWVHEENGRYSDALIELRAARAALRDPLRPSCQADADLLRLAIPHDGGLRKGEEGVEACGSQLLTSGPLQKGEGDLLILLFRGHLPEKESKRRGPLLVGEYQSRPSEAWEGSAWIDGKEAGRLELLDDLSELIRLEHEASIKAEMARSGVREGAKLAAAVTIKTAAALVGAEIQGNMKESAADLRTWSSLPAHVYWARVRAPVGRHDVVLRLQAPDGSQGPQRVLADQAFLEGRCRLYARWFR